MVFPFPLMFSAFFSGLSSSAVSARDTGTVVFSQVYGGVHARRLRGTPEPDADLCLSYSYSLEQSAGFPSCKL